MPAFKDYSGFSWCTCNALIQIITSYTARCTILIDKFNMFGCFLFRFHVLSFIFFDHNIFINILYWDRNMLNRSRNLLNRNKNMLNLPQINNIWLTSGRWFRACIILPCSSSSARVPVTSRCRGRDFHSLPTTNSSSRKRLLIILLSCWSQEMILRWLAISSLNSWCCLSIFSKSQTKTFADGMLNIWGNIFYNLNGQTGRNVSIP